ncbi:MAG: response regulator, partial [Armatimonadetes bacterium]|nr:response regulator [Armatimonadota bacterium]
LVVDDDPDIVEAVRTVLAASGYAVETARDGEEGLERIRQDVPDLLVLDLLMPRMDGFAVVRTLKEKPRWASIPIVILTAVGEEVSRRRYELETGLAMDVDDYLEKPLRPAELLHRVGKVLERRGRRARLAG